MEAKQQLFAKTGTMFDNPVLYQLQDDYTYIYTHITPLPALVDGFRYGNIS
jgi:hypothetical protein